MLRFFERRDFRSVGAALGISDDAAQKRVSRALEKLREMLANRGVTLTLAAALELDGGKRGQRGAGRTGCRRQPRWHWRARLLERECRGAREMGEFAHGQVGSRGRRGFRSCRWLFPNGIWLKPAAGAPGKAPSRLWPNPPDSPSSGGKLAASRGGSRRSRCSGLTAATQLTGAHHPRRRCGKTRAECELRLLALGKRESATNKASSSDRFGVCESRCRRTPQN